MRVHAELALKENWAGGLFVIEAVVSHSDT